MAHKNPGDLDHTDLIKLIDDLMPLFEDRSTPPYELLNRGRELLDAYQLRPGSDLIMIPKDWGRHLYGWQARNGPTLTVVTHPGRFVMRRVLEAAVKEWKAIPDVVVAVYAKQRDELVEKIESLF